MFDITTEDILQLDDVQLRELIARLAAAEAQRHGYSPLCVTWGGSQTAADGGLDVRVELPATAANCEPALPRLVTGYQVKKSDMPRSEITVEMRPDKKLRPVLSELASIGGAYIIVSSTGTTADLRLQERRQAMRDAVHDCPNGSRLHLDFFDRTRVADWVRDHPGLVLWVREKVGRAFDGWWAYGPWSHAGEPEDAPYLFDDRLRIHIGDRETSDCPVEKAVTSLRSILAKPREAVRIVGLSGVGKTRLVQALFDHRVGENSLAKSEAIYTDLNANPTPQPVSLATDLIAQGRRAVLIVDNCGSALHHELVKACAQRDSKISLITVEYDVREDFPEGTKVVTIDTASAPLIKELISRRYPTVSQIDANTIAAAADGNARIALAIAGTVGATDNLTRLTSQDLFDRLFWQRHQEDKSLLRAAQAFALVYSFDGESEAGEVAELPRLANLINQDVDDVFALLAELQRRDLVQRRANWRAVLPHALANHLAGRALDEIHPQRIREHIIESGNARLLRSFTRRLAYLDNHSIAVGICEAWLKPGGMLSDVSRLTVIERDMFQNVASVAPALALAALERLTDNAPERAVVIWQQEILVVRAIAYDAALFDRCITLLLCIIQERRNLDAVGDVRDVLVSFFYIEGSGTQAPVAKRFALLSIWLTSAKPAVREIGKAALQRALSTYRNYQDSFAFGARSRDYGKDPATDTEIADWYASALSLLDGLVDQGGRNLRFVRGQMGTNFPKLWSFPFLRDALEALMLKCAVTEFWPHGWSACQETLRQQGADLANRVRLQDLSSQLQPVDLASVVLSVVRHSKMHVRDKRQAAEIYISCKDLGVRVAHNIDVFAKLLPELLPLAHGDRVERFGRGLGDCVADLAATWELIVKAWSAMEVVRRRPALLRGFFAALAQRDGRLAQRCLDDCLTNCSLAPVLPALQDSIGWDEAGLARVSKAFSADLVPITEFHYLKEAVKTSAAVRRVAEELLARIAAKPQGFSVAIEVLTMWRGETESGGQEAIERLRAPSRAVLRHFGSGNNLNRVNASAVEKLAEIALVGADVAPLVRSLARTLRHAVRIAEQSLFWYQSGLLRILIRHQPGATLTALFEGDAEARKDAVCLFRGSNKHFEHPAKDLDPAVLIAWCEHEKSERIRFALEIVQVVEPAAVPGRARLTSQARALLLDSPAPKVSLEQIGARLLSQNSGESQAAIMEVNATALDDVLDLFQGDYQAFARQVKTKLLETAEAVYAQETDWHRARDERFEP